VRGVTIGGMVKRTKNNPEKAFETSLETFTRADWKNQIGVVKVADGSESLLDLVVACFRGAFEAAPDRFDIPFLTVPLDRFEGAAQVPFAVTTWECLSVAGVDSDLDVMVLMVGTFRELVDRLGDVRAAVDFAVTGHAWVAPNGHNSFGFVAPIAPATLVEAGVLARQRVFRARGLAPDASMYTPEFAEVMGWRWGVGVATRWTLERCGGALDLTRERVRQIEHLSMWEAANRVWGRTLVLEEVFNQLIESPIELVSVEATMEEVERDAAVSLLLAFGYDGEDLRGPVTLADELELLGVKLDEVRQMAFKESERLGFMSLVELRHHVSENFPELVGEFLEEVIGAVTVMSDLPYGYVYVDWRGTSYFRSSMISLISVVGPQTVDELYKAAVRYFKWRIPRLSFPPRLVVEEFFCRSEEFWMEDGVVGLTDSHDRRSLEGVEKWVYDTIQGCTGHVIHSVELWSHGREAGMKSGTMRAYSRYSLYFKPLPGAMLTITGMQPADVVIDLARRRANAIRIPMDRRSVEVMGGDVIVEIQLGNNLLDTGVLSSTVEMRKMLAGQSFAAFANEKQFGHIVWSGASMAGFVGVFQELGAFPSDIVRLTFSTSSQRVTAEIVEE